MSLRLFKYILCFIFCAFSSSAALAIVDQNVFKAKVDRSKISKNETLDLILTVNKTQYSDFDFPLTTPDYQVVAHATFTNVQIVNGQMAQEKTINYSLKPKRIGKITIPAAKLKISGKEYSTKPIEIEVTELARYADKKPVQQNTASQAASRQAAQQASQQARRSPPAKQPSRQPPRQSSRQPSRSRQQRDSVFAKAEVSKLNPYKSEQVLLKLKLYHQGDLKDISVPVLDFDNFFKEAVDEAREYKETFEGVEYLVYELDYILFPLKTGSLSIPEISIETSVLDWANRDPFSIFSGSFMSTVPKLLKTERINLNVLPLPPNAPIGFTGYVGDLKVTNTLEKKDVKKGEALTLTTRFYGSGNLDLLNLDFIPNSSSYSTFKDKVMRSSQVENLVRYAKIISKAAIIPQKSGKVSLNLKPIISFNPILKRYETHGGDKFIIDVLAGAASQALDAQGNPLKKASKTGFWNRNKALSPREILNIPPDRVLKNGHFAVNYNYALLILLILNGIAALIVLVRFLIGKELVAGLGRRNGVSFSKLEKQISKAASIEEISKLLKDLLSQLGIDLDDSSLNSEFKDKVDKFFHKSDMGNYGQVAVSLEELQQDGLTLLKEIKDHHGRK